ncbi:MAG TPA: sodium:solute symporter family protein [Bacteroidetes bacterium]|nr:putative symporter YidK [bacterium BMS3Bbin04]HDO65160.1 sodium:solute symporter family protein [Bacteroidota bacterium]HEX04285.1 sodium:solute symporter family protein [Bacteroidota bacterium]
MHLGAIDTAIVAAYFLLLVVLTLRARRGDRSSAEEFLLAGRRLTGPAFVATLVSTWYGSILAVGEYSYLYGISNWLVFGVPYYLAALLFAFFLAGRARRSAVLTIPDQLEKTYGRKVAIVGTVVVFIITVPAAYILMLGELLQWFLGGSTLIWMIAGGGFSLLYVLHGGFRNVVRTDLPQFILMYLGFIILLGMAFHEYGGFSYLKANLPESHLSPNGGLGWAAVLVWYFIALQTLIEPTFYQRCYAAKSEAVARGGLIVSVGFWLVFDLLTTFSGLYARAILGDNSEAMLSYPLLAEKILPVGLLGLFFVSLLSVVMSTVDSYLLLAGQTLGHDLWRRLKRRDKSEVSVPATRVGLVIALALAIAIAVWKQSAIAIFHDLGSIATPVLLIPMIASLYRKHPLPRAHVLFSMLLCGSVTLIWTTLGSYGSGYPLNIHPIYIGLGLSALALAPALLRSRR